MLFTPFEKNEVVMLICFTRFDNIVYFSISVLDTCFHRKHHLIVALLIMNLALLIMNLAL